MEEKKKEETFIDCQEVIYSFLLKTMYWFTNKSLNQYKHTTFNCETVLKKAIMFAFENSRTVY